MLGSPSNKAFTLVEVCVTTAFLGLLASIVVPGLQTTRTDRRRAACLANLQQIGGASLMYATEDDREQMIPIHPMNVRSDATRYISNGPWCWRTALPISYGGRTAITPMLVDGSYQATALMMEDRWGTPTRPLNQYADLEAFHCPADTGYPAFDPADWGGSGNMDSPPQMAGIPCWDFLGNSYRGNTLGFTLTYWGTSPKWKAMFDSGPKGHAVSLIENPSRITLYCDPIFHTVARQLSGSLPLPPIDPITGWHGQLMADNVAYCDGSARMTEIGELYEWDLEELDEIGLGDDYGPRYFLCRGPTWQMDSYPAPGALIRVFHYISGVSLISPEAWDSYCRPGWPFDRHTINECSW